jgi:hypothetical protein
MNLTANQNEIACHQVGQIALAFLKGRLLLAIIRKRIFLEVGRRVFGGMAELKSKVFQIAVG